MTEERKKRVPRPYRLLRAMYAQQELAMAKLAEANPKEVIQLLKALVPLNAQIERERARLKSRERKPRTTIPRPEQAPENLDKFKNL